MQTIRLTTIASLVVAAAACAGTPKNMEERQSLEASASATLNEMRARDPSLGAFLDGAAGYVVFPEIGKGGAIVGGAHGIGVLYEGGRVAGYVELSQGSIGAQLGGQTFSELVVLGDTGLVQRVKSDTFDIGMNASAVALQEGAARSARFVDGVAVFTLPRGGLMAELSVSGQQLQFVPRDRG